MTSMTSGSARTESAGQLCAPQWTATVRTIPWARPVGGASATQANLARRSYHQPGLLFPSPHFKNFHFWGRTVGEVPASADLQAAQSRQPRRGDQRGVRHRHHGHGAPAALRGAQPQAGQRPQRLQRRHVLVAQLHTTFRLESLTRAVVFPRVRFGTGDLRSFHSSSPPTASRMTSQYSFCQLRWGLQP